MRTRFMRGIEGLGTGKRTSQFVRAFPEWDSSCNDNELAIWRIFGIGRELGSDFGWFALMW